MGHTNDSVSTPKDAQLRALRSALPRREPPDWRNPGMFPGRDGLELLCAYALEAAGVARDNARRARGCGLGAASDMYEEQASWRRLWAIRLRARRRAVRSAAPESELRPESELEREVAWEDDLLGALPGDR